SAIEDEGAVKKVVSDSGTVYRSQAVILATGASPRRLDIPGEDRLTGKGVSYCATCDGALFKGRTVAVIGGGDTAVGEAVFLTRFAEKVYLIHRRDAFRASKILQERAFANEKVSVLWNRAPVEIIGKDRVESLLLRDTLSGGEETLLCGGVFVLAGTVPESSFVKGLVSLDEKGYIITDSRMETSVPGIFSAGDVNKKDFRQVATAVGDGANAAHFAEIYLENLK
ncbi:MAG: FAD-dependent oxidoreductase, partial [Abditibacteriota bacterium]|nr:FAD-dependent oxidoreductase [Abditibacteriota bacterium]